MSGQPAISLPLHWNADGLPIGVQLVAAYGREDVLVRVGVPARGRPPLGRSAPTGLTRRARRDQRAVQPPSTMQRSGRS